MMEIIKISADAVCDAGTVRKNNEDMVAVDDLIFRNGAYQLELSCQDMDDSVILAVSDGIGGANAGEAASEYVLNELLAARRRMPAGKDFQQLKNYFEETVKKIHGSLMSEAVRDTEKIGMGATLTAVLLFKDRVFYFSAGDSRLYRFRRSILKQISIDHSLSQLTGTSRSDSHVIYNSIGGGESVFIDFKEITGQIMNGDFLLLCSDGLTDMMDDCEIEDQLDSLPNASDLCDLVKRLTPGRDNISIILARLETADANDD